MRCVSGQKQAAKAHRLGHKAAQGRNAFLDGSACDQIGTGLLVQAQAQLGPKSIVRPLVQRIGERHLQVVAAARGAALRTQGKAAWAVDVNELVVHRRRVRQQSQPAKGIDFFKLFDGPTRHAGAAHAVKAVATGNKVAGNFKRLTVFLEPHTGLVGVKVQHLHLAGLVIRGQTGLRARVHQVAGDLSLSIDHHVLAAGERGQIHPVALTGKQHVKAAVHQAVAVHACAHTGLVEQVHGDLLEHASADAAQHVVRALALHNHRVDTGLVQQLAQQQTGGTCANNGDLGANGTGHGFRP